MELGCGLIVFFKQAGQRCDIGAAVIPGCKAQGWVIDQELG